MNRYYGRGPSGSDLDRPLYGRPSNCRAPAFLASANHRVDLSRVPYRRSLIVFAGGGCWPLMVAWTILKRRDLPAQLPWLRSFFLLSKNSSLERSSEAANEPVILPFLACEPPRPSQRISAPPSLQRLAELPRRPQPPKASRTKTMTTPATLLLFFLRLGSCARHELVVHHRQGVAPPKGFSCRLSCFFGPVNSGERSKTIGVTWPEHNARDHPEQFTSLPVHFSPPLCS